MRDHQPVVIEEFNGFWNRNDGDGVPIDHFSDVENVIYSDSCFETRPGIDPYRAVGRVLRMYNYTMQEGQSLLLLNDVGQIYHSIDESTLHGPILEIPTMEDFNIVSIAGRAYINPIERTVTSQNMTREVGMENEFLYVYKGDGTAARKAAGNPPTNNDDTATVAYNSSQDGVIDQGIHVIAISFLNGADDSLALGPDPFPVIYAPGGKEAYIQNIPIGGVGITARRIWMTHSIDPKNYNPDDITDADFFLALEIADNTTVSAIINIADIDLTTAFVAGTSATPADDGLKVENTSTEGFVDVGLHIIGVVYETDTGYLTAPGPEVLGVQTFANENRAITVTGIPVSPDSFVTKRHLVATKAIMNYNGDDLGYQLFFIPDGTINDNVTTTWTGSFYDIDLIEDASHLLDNYAEIPAGVTLTTFHGRLVSSTTFDDISILLVSYPGEPEAINQVDGIVIIPLDGNPITTAQQFRDVLYVFKQTRTFGLTDNGDVPATWEPLVIDQGIGASVHGIATVLDSGGVNIDYLIIVDYSGVMMFNGAFMRPELTWKIQHYWLDGMFDETTRAFFGYIQIMNDSLNQILYITLPSRRMLMGDYKNGLDAKSIRWAKWRFDVRITTIALINTDTLLLASDQLI